MTTGRLREHDLERILDELFVGPTPAYRTEALSAAVRVKQRPGWTFVGRWMGVNGMDQPRTPASAVPWRTVAIVALVTVSLIVGALILAGSRQRRLPAPYGPAGNGLIAYSENGDIYVGDPISRSSRALTTGPDVDDRPTFSRDGTEVAFLRQASRTQEPCEGGPCDVSTWNLMVMDASGGPVRRLSASPFGDPSELAWSGDGRRIALSAYDARSVLRTFEVATGTMTTAELGVDIGTVAFRPLHDDEILVTSNLLEIVHADGSHRRSLPLGLRPISSVRWSPDGSRLAYSTIKGESADGHSTTELHILNVDSGLDRIVSGPRNTNSIDDPEWSPDGMSLLVEREGASEKRLVDRAGSDGLWWSIIRVDGSPEFMDIVSRNSLIDDNAYWSPDGRQIIISFAYTDVDPIMLIDLQTGQTKPGWYGDWQRIAP